MAPQSFMMTWAQLPKLKLEPKLKLKLSVQCPTPPIPTTRWAEEGGWAPRPLQFHYVKPSRNSPPRCRPSSAGRSLLPRRRRSRRARYEPNAAVVQVLVRILVQMLVLVLLGGDNSCRASKIPTSI